MVGRTPNTSIECVITNALVINGISFSDEWGIINQVSSKIKEDYHTTEPFVIKMVSSYGAPLYVGVNNNYVRIGTAMAQSIHSKTLKP